MKKLVIFFVSLLITGLLFSKTPNIVKFHPASVVDFSSREETIVYLEDFENGMPNNWHSEDVTNPGSYWFISPYNAYGNNGNSWRMADPNIGNNGGYEDGWYQVLDTPVISLPYSNNLTLSFQQFRAIEEPGNYENFDGWDGFNVRIRLADAAYADAEILTDCTPAYNCNSLYGFGQVHGEDPDGVPGIPGWGGSTDWQTTEIVIPSFYQGKNVIISFAFAADANTSTISNPEFSGIFLDEIEVAGVFYNDAETTTGFVGFTNTPIGGDLWHSFTNNNVTAIGCFDELTELYNPNMQNYLTTEAIFLPTASEINLDFLVQTALDDSLFPNCDYFSVEVSYLNSGNWSNWNSISNPDGAATGQNLVFTGTVNQWTSFSQGWPGYNDLTVIGGHYAKFRFGFHSNSNPVYGFGIMIDEFKISSSIFAGSPPENLTASLLADNSVQLQWDSPSGSILEYNVYRKTENDDFELIAFSPTNSFIDANPQENALNYYSVTAVFAEGESDFSNPVSVFVVPPTATIMQHDDGTAEAGLTVLPLQQTAVLFEPDYSNGEISLTHFQIYLTTLADGPLAICVWQEENSFPAAELPGFPLSINSEDLHLGWNTIELPADLIQTFNGENFFAGAVQFVDSPEIGLDENNVGFSYLANDTWNILSSELMIRIVIDSEPIFPTHNSSNLVLADLRLTNFPNPFNPSTTISFNLNKSEAVEVIIFNQRGQIVKRFSRQILPAGNNLIFWDGKNIDGHIVCSGIYYTKVIINNKNKTKKMLLIK